MDEQPRKDPELPSPPPGLSQGPAYRPPAPPASQTSRAGLLTLAGGALVVISVFLPWFTVDVPGSTIYTVSEFRGGAFGLLILGGFAIVRGLSLARIGGMQFRMGSPLIGGVIMVVLLVIRWNDIHDAIEQTKALSPTITASVGIGFWGAALGAALVLAGGVMTLQSRR
jgi:hypothetical protein